jgi:hypothetical protein
MAAPKTRVFLSYAADDRAAAEKLAEGLRGQSLGVWTDALLGPGENYAASVARALEEADAIVVLLTPRSVESEWVRWEIGYALSSKRFESRLIPVVIGDERGAWLSKAPWVLKKLHMVTSSTAARASKQVADILRRPTLPRRPALRKVS